jgi:methyltransferase (TIGR00027 family)
MLTAAARALCREDPQPWVLGDSFALELAGDAGISMLNVIRARLSRDQLMAFSRWVCVRSRVVEDLVQRALSKGVQQYVILGAGLDSFAYRRVDLLDRLRVFEVDHPASQRWKRERLEQLSIPTPKGLIFAPVDFESQSLIDGLVASGFEAEAPAVFSWIGVTMYLTTDAIRKTLRAVASCGHGSQIVLTYNQPASTLDALSRTVGETLADTIGQGGEPFISLFTPEAAQALVREEGFRDIQDYGGDEARRDYFQSREDVLIAGVQRILIGAVP